MKTISSLVPAILLSSSFLISCSGGSSGGGGGGGTTATGLIQTSKLSCSGNSCIGASTISTSSYVEPLLHPLAVSSAVSLYDTFNQTLIPAFNSIIATIETGVKNAGAVSCNDISIGFSGNVAVGATTYTAQTSTSAATASAALFTSTTMSKRLVAKVSGGSNFLTADFNCGLGSDVSPLVARIVTNDGTNPLNAWFEKGTSSHVRVLMIAKYGGVVYSAWFKTDDGDSYEIALASAGVAYWGAGKKSTNVINYQDTAGQSLTCLNATTGGVGAGCSTTLAAPPTISNDLSSSTIATWTNVNNSVTLVAPSYP